VSTGPQISSCSSEAAVRVEQFVTEQFHCGGAQGQKHQNHTRGPRRGGRPRPQHARAAPITEHLHKLSLSSDCTQGSIKAKTQGDEGRQMQEHLEACQSRTGREACAEQQEMKASSEHRATHQSGLEADCPKDGADSGGGRDHRGRRRGPHRPVPHAGANRPPRHHWDSRATRSGGSGPHRGQHGRGFHQKVVERGREEVL